MTDSKETSGANPGTERPAVESDEAAGIARERFGLSGPLRELPSERDRNFRVETERDGDWVLKIAAATESEDALELQHAAVAHALALDPSLPLPTPRPDAAGSTLQTITTRTGDAHLARAVRWIDGTPLAEFLPRTPALLHALGGALGRLDTAWADFEHAAADRPLQWDLRRAPDVIRDHLDAVAEPARRTLVETALARWDDVPDACKRSLRLSVVHNDPNDWNVLVAAPLLDDGTAPPRIAGLIDLGDMLRTWTLAEPAIAAAYALLDAPSPLGALRDLVRGYHEACPIPEAELPALFPLVLLRLATSVVLSARQREIHPDNAYLSISEAPAWRLLERLVATPPALALGFVREACRLDPAPSSAAFRAWAIARRTSFAPVLGRALEPDETVVLDLDVASPDVPLPDAATPLAELTATIEARLAREGAAPRVGIGRYGEPRLLYASELFTAADDAEPRTVHLGVDLFAPAGTAVHAPLAGTVVGLAVNANPLDYGPTVILRHEPEDGPSFLTLYGHLQAESHAHLALGQPIASGEVFAHLGEPSENGGWTPHLHFQVMLDALEPDGASAGDFDGVCAASEFAVWTSLVPDPAPLLGLEPGAATWTTTPNAELLAARRAHTSRASSVSYREPLHIVRGYRQHLYDVSGRRWLDAVNNVPHVGHAHPRVVRAVAEQMRVLNTNTRYLHERYASYVERLAALFPDPLEVVFLVNSGSEANELALRLARAHTSRHDVAVLDGAYHGNTGELVAMSPYKWRRKGGFPQPPHIHVVPAPDAYRGAHRDEEGTAEAYAEEARVVFEQACAAGRNPAAFFAEPLLGCAGQIVPPEGYLRAAFRHARAAGIVCVADEVQVGFGRAGSHFWAFEAQDCVPDVVTLGKPIGNGHPLGAVVTTRAIAASLETGMEWFNTFGGNPASCAAGEAVLDVIEAEGLQENARRVGELLLAELGAALDGHARVGDVRGLGLYVGIELVRDRASRAPHTALATSVANRMKERGILISTDGPDANVLKVKPPLCFDRDDANRLVATLSEILAEPSHL